MFVKLVSQQAALSHTIQYVDLTSVVSESERWVESERQLSLALAMTAECESEKFMILFSVLCDLCTCGSSETFLR